MERGIRRRSAFIHPYATSSYGCRGGVSRFPEGNTTSTMNPLEGGYLGAERVEVEIFFRNQQAQCNGAKTLTRLGAASYIQGWW